MGDKVLGERLFLGRTPTGDRVYVTVRVCREFGEGRNTIEHEPSGSYDGISVQGEMFAGTGFRDSNLISIGQCIDGARQVLNGGTLARGASRADVQLIVDAWDRWHLNGMQAACAHMTPVGDDLAERLRLTPPCPVSGYRYGAEWLIEPLPDGLVADLTAACERLAR